MQQIMTVGRSLMADLRVYLWTIPVLGSVIGFVVALAIQTSFHFIPMKLSILVTWTFQAFWLYVILKAMHLERQYIRSLSQPTS